MKKHSNSYSPSNDRVNKGKKNLRSALNIFLSLACISLGIAYLLQMNNLTIKGFALKEMKSRASMLAEANEELQAKALSLQSYSAFSPRLNNLDMVVVDEIVYLNSDSLTVAKK